MGIRFQTSYVELLFLWAKCGFRICLTETHFHIPRIGAANDSNVEHSFRNETLLRIRSSVLLPSQLVNYFFHHNWSTTSSITAGQLLLPLHLVNYFFHHSWSTTSSITAGQLLLPSQLVNYFFHHSWSTTSSITAGQLLLPSQLVNYFFHHS